MSDEAVKFAWRRQRAWSTAGDTLKRHVTRVRTVSLITLVAAAIAGAIAAQLHETEPAWATGAAIVAALAVAIGTFGRSTLGKNATQTWTGVRRVSEALKTEIFTYLAGVAPYRGGDMATELLDRVEKIEKAAKSLERHLSGIAPVGKDIPEITDVPSYTKIRVTGQIEDYYRDRARKLETKLRRFRRADLGFGFGGAVLTALVGFLGGGTLTVWIGVLTTIVAAFAAHVLQSEYEYQLSEFNRTANGLELLCTRQGSGGSLTDDEFVAACERVISDQNDAWLARLAAVAEEQP